MLKKIKPIIMILRHKNKQIRAEREKYEALEQAYGILSAYVALFIEEHGGCVTVSKAGISDAIGKYSVELERIEGDYVLTARKNGKGGACVGEQ